MYPCFSTRFTGRYFIWYWYVTMVTVYACHHSISSKAWFWVAFSAFSEVHTPCMNLLSFFLLQKLLNWEKKVCDIIILYLCTQFMIYLNLLFSILKLKDQKSTILKTLGQKYINFCKVILSFLNYYLLVKKRFNLNSMYVYMHLHLHFFICFLFQS